MKTTTTRTLIGDVSGFGAKKRVFSLRNTYETCEPYDAMNASFHVISKHFTLELSIALEWPLSSLDATAAACIVC